MQTVKHMDWMGSFIKIVWMNMDTHFYIIQVKSGNLTGVEVQ